MQNSLTLRSYNHSNNPPQNRKMKNDNLLLAVFLLTVFQLRFVNAQDEKGIHTFKIVGNTRIQTTNGEKVVEYDPENLDHLYISFFNSNDKIITKTRFLFKEKKFELIRAVDYLVNDDLLLDGAHVSFFENGSIDKELIYKSGTIKQEIEFYPNGKRKSLVSVNDQTKNGVYQMWHLNGLLSFSGEYSNNLKNGEFQQFDESEKLIKKGTYLYGKLVSGEPVVQDMIFKMPEIMAKFSKEIASINEEIKLKFDALIEPKSFLAQKVKLSLIIDKTGKVLEVRKGSLKDSLLLSVSNKLLKDMTIFYPAKVENILVDSELIVEFKLSKKDFSILSVEPLPSLNAVDKPRSENQPNVYGKVEQMPEYPGGQEGLRKFLAITVRYPIEALQKGIQGKVFVNFVIDETGEITKIQIAKGVHKSLDQEALRVVQLMPKWTPGIQDGKPVKVSYTVPISFRQEIVNP